MNRYVELMWHRWSGWVGRSRYLGLWPLETWAGIPNCWEHRDDAELVVAWRIQLLDGEVVAFYKYFSDGRCLWCSLFFQETLSIDRWCGGCGGCGGCVGCGGHWYICGVQGTCGVFLCLSCCCKGVEDCCRMNWQAILSTPSDHESF